MADYLNPILLLNSNIHWIKSDPIVKGFFFELLSFSCNPENKGTIDNDDDFLRKLLKIPLPWTIRDVNTKVEDPTLDFLNKSFSTEGISQVMLDTLRETFNDKTSDNPFLIKISYEQWADYLWINIWKPQLMSLWEIVDQKVTRKHQDLKPFVGKLWNETAFLLSLGKIPLQDSTVKVKKVVKNKKEELPNINSVDFIFDYGDLGYNGMAWLHGETDNFEDLSKNLKVWRTPPTIAESNSIWEVGTSLLANSPQDYVAAKRFLGKMVKEYGSQLVAKAVAEMVTKQNFPTDKFSFMIGILKREKEGRPEVVKARNARAKLAL